MMAGDSNSPWLLLRRGMREDGLVILQERYKRSPSPSHMMELGVAYLWVENYKAAWEHFHHAIRTDRTPGDVYYGMAGVAKWCGGDSEAAIAQWHAGLGAPYAVGGAGIHLPLLLLLGSVLRPGLFSKDEAERLLTLRISDPRARSWPGPLGQFVLGQIDDAAMEASWIGSRGRGVRGPLPHLKWLTEFYKLVLQLARGDLTLSSYQESMRHMVDTSLPEWSEESDFLSLLWNEEFYIGRDEASRKPHQN